MKNIKTTFELYYFVLSPKVEIKELLNDLNKYYQNELKFSSNQ